MKNEGNLNVKNLKEESSQITEEIENKINNSNKPKHQCFECHKFEVKHKTFMCFSCRTFKCSECASLDCMKTKQNIKGNSYICINCFCGETKIR